MKWLKWILDQNRRCPECGITDGAHVPGCPNERRR